MFFLGKGNIRRIDENKQCNSSLMFLQWNFNVL